MSRYAVVESSGLVENVILLEEVNDWPVPEGDTLYLLGDNQPCGPGWQLVGSEFVLPS